MEIDVYKKWIGIPEEFRPPTHYQLLRLVDFEDNSETIQAHYKKLNGVVRKYATGDYMLQSQELLNELAKAMLCLTDKTRKREYDESLGREFEGEDERQLSLLEILVASDELDHGQISEIEQFADRRGLTHRDAVVQMKLVSTQRAAEALAEELGRPFVDLESTLSDDNVLDQVPRKVVKKNGILPLFIDEDVILVAATDEPDHLLEDEFRLRFGKPMRAVIATPLQINQSIAKYYAPGVRDEVVAAEYDNRRAGAKAKKKKQKEKAAQTTEPEVELTPEQKKEQKMIGFIIMAWSLLGSAAVDQFIIKDMFLPRWSFFVGFVLVVPPIVFVMIKDKYFKK